MAKYVLVTGGAGYIGSHTCVELLDKGYRCIVVDCLDNSSREALKRVKEITHCTDDELVLEVCDLVEYDKAKHLFDKYCVQKGIKFDACIHFAGLKAVGESVTMPLEYYMNNITSTLNLVNLCDKYDCHNLVFSSSATVYGDPHFFPITEDHPLSATNPYGRTKLMIEDILRDVVKAKPDVWSIALLRYFNPVGAHISGRIGEDPKGKPNNLLPFVSQVAVGKRNKLSVFGNDYDTKDGTGVRDFIHVVDLAKGHLAAVKKVTQKDRIGAQAYNLGTGCGVSVLELVSAFEKACGKKIPYEITARREGDIGTCFADPHKAYKELGWQAEQSSVERICEDAWRWQSQNPNGYRPGNEDGANEPRKCVVFKMYH